VVDVVVSVELDVVREVVEIEVVVELAVVVDTVAVELAVVEDVVVKVVVNTVVVVVTVTVVVVFVLVTVAVVELAVVGDEDLLVAGGVTCSNMAEVLIGAATPTANRGECSARCSSEPDCAWWNYRFNDDPASCSTGQVGDCMLLRDGCVQESTECWDLYSRQSEAADEAQFVFQAGDAGITCFRIPAIVRTPLGRLVAFTEARHGPKDRECWDEFAHEIIASRSDDFGKTWSPLATVVGSQQNPVHNPYPIALRNGKIVLVYGKHAAVGWDGHTGVGIGVVFSTDGGETWSQEADVSDQFGPAMGAQPGPGAGVALEMTPSKDRLIVVSHLGEYTRDFVTISDDEGATWTTVDHTFPSMDEGALAYLGNGEVLLVMRHKQMSTKGPTMGRAISRSTDYGKTWSELSYNNDIQSAMCEGSLLHHEGVTYFSAPVIALDPEFWRREQIVVRQSKDGGRSWFGDKLVQAKQGPGYSCLVPGNGPELGVLFESDEGIQFTRVVV
jgi:sialidase-1